MPAPGDAPTTAAVLGQGSIGRRHAGILRDLGCTVHAWDPAGVPEDGPAIAGECAEDVLAAADVAVIASPSVHHREQISMALDNGCDILVEKPPATTVQGLADLARRAQRDGRVVAVAFNLRFHPGPSTVAEVVRSGRIGRPLAAQVAFGSFLPDWRPGVDLRATYSARSDLGGGVLLDAIHELDYTTWILGRALDVDARLARQSDLPLDVEDTAILTVGHAAGPLSTITLDYLDRAYHRGCRVVGTEASVTWSWEDEIVRVIADDVRDEWPAPADAIGDSYRRQMRAFLDSVTAREVVTPLCALEDAIPTMELADAARTAAITERRVRLPA